MSDAESKLTYVDGKVAGAKDDAKDDTLKLAYNVFDEWKLPSTATVQTAEGVGDTTVDVKWVDYAAPNTDELKSDADGKLYVERKYFFFDGLTMRYPSADAFTAKIYLENFNTEVKEIVPDGMSRKYDVFDKFEFARTATVYMNDGTKHENVPIHWESTSMPTADEIKQGSFTRKIRILGAYVEGQDIYSDYVVTVNNDFTIDNRRCKRQLLSRLAKERKRKGRHKDDPRHACVERQLHRREWLQRQYDSHDNFQGRRQRRARK